MNPCSVSFPSPHLLKSLSRRSALLHISLRSTETPLQTFPSLMYKPLGSSGKPIKSMWLPMAYPALAQRLQLTPFQRICARRSLLNKACRTKHKKDGQVGSEREQGNQSVSQSGVVSSLGRLGNAPPKCEREKFSSIRFNHSVTLAVTVLECLFHLWTSLC